MSRPDSTQTINVLVIDNHLATPGPLWIAMMQNYSHWLTNRRDSVFSATDFPAAAAPRGITLAFKESEHWLLIDGTRRALPEAVATALLAHQLHAIVMLINVADYNPLAHRSSAR